MPFLLYIVCLFVSQKSMLVPVQGEDKSKVEGHLETVL